MARTPFRPYHPDIDGWMLSPDSRRTWSDAEFFDEPFPDGLVLRALVCLLEDGQWEWTINVLGQGKGEMISTGIAKTLAKARQTAIAEIAQCR